MREQDLAYMCQEMMHHGDLFCALVEDSTARQLSWYNRCASPAHRHVIRSGSLIVTSLVWSFKQCKAPSLIIKRNVTLPACHL